MPDRAAPLKRNSHIGEAHNGENFNFLTHLRQIAPKLIKIEESRFILFSPFMFASGAAIAISYFPMMELRFAIICAILAFLLFIIIAMLARKSNRITPHFLSLIMFMILLGLCGFLSGQFRIRQANAPILTHQIYDANISGEIITISRSTYGSQRAKIKVKSIEGIDAAALPKYIRLNIEGLKYNDIGKELGCRAFLGPPPAKTLPNSYDFPMWAYFSQVGGFGRCKGEFNVSAKNGENFARDLVAQLNYLRGKKAAEITNNRVGGGAGFLAAIATGDRSYLAPSDTKALQIAGLGHIISVSGLHVGLLGGILFFAFRKFFSLFPAIALRLDTKKIAAVLSFIFVVYYTYFTGAEAPALRSMIMFGAASFAILINRRAISMRGLAIAALILLVWHPENSLDAGFLMSFLATMALVSLWEIWHKSQFTKPRNSFEKAGFWVIGAALTSLVAGLATIPISLFSYQSMNTYGLITNVLAAPLNDFIIAPSAIIGVVFQKTWVGEFFLQIAIWGLQKVLDIAQFFSNLPSSTISLAGFDEKCAFVAVFAIVWFCFFISKLRYIGLFFLAVSGLLWFVSPQTEASFSADANAMMQFSKNDYRLCYNNKGKYSARQLVNSSTLGQKEKQQEIANLEFQNRNCSLYGGDWEAHFVGKDEATYSALKSINAKPKVISILIRGKNYIIDQNHTPNGALLARFGDKLELLTKSIPAPWRAKTNEVQISQTQEL